MKLPQLKNKTQIYEVDITQEFRELAVLAGVVAWDIETSGLNWRSDKIATCQLHVPDGPAALVRIQDSPPKQLASLLADSSVKKIFHYALFDLRFMASQWEVTPRNIACTKVAANLLDRDKTYQHSLQTLVGQFLGVSIDKTERTSNWLAPHLTKKQLAYAITDVLHLPALLSTLELELTTRGLLDLAHACFDHIPTRVQLEILGYDDVYQY